MEDDFELAALDTLQHGMRARRRGLPDPDACQRAHLAVPVEMDAGLNYRDRWITFVVKPRSRPKTVSAACDIDNVEAKAAYQAADLVDLTDQHPVGMH